MNLLKKKKIVYALGLLITLFLFFINYYQYSSRLDATASTSQSVTVRIKKTSCSNFKSYLVFEYKGSNHILNLNAKDCVKYANGDSLILLYNQTRDMFYLNNETTSPSEIYGMILSGFFFLLILCYSFFPKFFEKHK
jgi:hypothetical protein